MEGEEAGEEIEVKSIKGGTGGARRVKGRERRKKESRGETCPVGKSERKRGS